MKELAIQETQLTTTEPSIATMLQGALAGGITKDNADALGKMLDVYERMQSKSAEQAFNAAFAKMQSEIPELVAESVIPNRGKYARFENVMHQIQPMLTANGFSVSFAQTADDKRITVTCSLRHVGGHSEKTPFAVRLGGKADSDTQADCKASTTAKRNALLQALNIVIRQDYLQNEDPHNEGGFITQEEADTLRDLCDECGPGNREKFLEYARAERFEQIHARQFDACVEALNKKLKATAR